MTAMGAKEAVTIAKLYVTDLFAEEGLVNLGLEEIQYDDVRSRSKITLGFSREPDADGNALNQIYVTMRRDYKVVTVDENGQVMSVKNRESINAGWIYIISSRAAVTDVFATLGLTDSALLKEAMADHLPLSADLDLQASRLRRKVINFNHYIEANRPA